MTSLRLALLAALILAGFVQVTVAAAQAPVEWYTDTGGGGVLAQPTPETRDGGAAAPPTASGEVDVPESDISATPPVASAAQAEPVLGAPDSRVPPRRRTTTPRRGPPRPLRRSPAARIRPAAATPA